MIPSTPTSISFLWDPEVAMATHVAERFQKVGVGTASEVFYTNMYLDGFRVVLQMLFVYPGVQMHCQAPQNSRLILRILTNQ